MEEHLTAMKKFKLLPQAERPAYVNLTPYLALRSQATSLQPRGEAIPACSLTPSLGHVPGLYSPDTFPRPPTHPYRITTVQITTPIRQDFLQDTLYPHQHHCGEKNGTQAFTYVK